jgi:hypothetical protein
LGADVWPALAITLVLQWRDVAGVPRPTIHQAQAELVRLYEGIGVHVEWDEPDRSDDRRPGDRRTMWVIILPEETGTLRDVADPVMGAALTTPQGTPVVYAYYRRVEEEARRFGASDSAVLACVIAHELGHLMLPWRAHAPNGLMSGRWRRDAFLSAEQGRLRYLPKEAALIRARLAARGLERCCQPTTEAR